MNANGENEKRPAMQGLTIWKVVLATLVALFFAGLLLPSVGGPRPVGRRSNCQSNVKNIILAIENYRVARQAFPQSVFFGENGTPRSWRVEILPQLEQQALRDKYRDDLPWNSPVNLELAKTHLPVFRCPSASPPLRTSECFMTNYVLITGPRTAFPDNKPASWRDIKDGSSNTIIMLEINESDIAWTEPRDLTIDEAIALFNRPEAVRRKHPTNHEGGRMVAFADGHVEFAKEDTPPDVLRALFTIDDGIAVTLEDAK